MALLEARSVTKIYRTRSEQVVALQDVSFTLDRGDFVALVGKSGCGKSTLLNLCGAMDFPTAGEIELNGRVTTNLSDAELTQVRREQVGFIFQSQIFGTFDQFLADCQSGNLPDYSFIEPNYTDHDVPLGRVLASDQHPDHNVLAGEEFIASVYMSILNNEELWNSTMLLIVYDEHGGMYDHVEPPACPADEFQDSTTGFKFDRLGVRVPAILVSPWIAKGTVVSNRVFDHASIPATVTKHFIGAFPTRSPRELAADTFLDFLTLAAPRQDYIAFKTGNRFLGAAAPNPPKPGKQALAANTAPDSAFQPNRPVSQLLLDQVIGLQKVEHTLPAERQTHIDITQITTEAQASAYIQAMMSILHPQAGAARPS